MNHTIPQLFTGKFSPREPKCPNEVAPGDRDSSTCEKTTWKIAPIGTIQ